MSSQGEEEIESDEDFQEDGSESEEGGVEVAVARPPLSVVPSVELVVSGQAALDTLDQVYDAHLCK